MALALKRAARLLTSTRNVMLPAQRISPPPAFARSFTTNAGGGNGDGDSSRYPRWVREVSLGKERPDCIMDFRPNTFMNYDDDGMTFRWEVPGCGKEDIKVSVDNYLLTVVNLKKKEAEGDEAGILMRLHVWPCWVKTSKITSKINNGLLTVVVPGGRDEN